MNLGCLVYVCLVFGSYKPSHGKSRLDRTTTRHLDHQIPRPPTTMSRRLQPTLIDYVVIAINPALIMVLIGSLIYFILEMCYQGQYPERLHFCLSMFILGAVL